MSTANAPSLSPSFSVIAERFRRAGQIDRAVALCREGLAVYPNHLSARVTLGCALMDQGQDAEAHRELQRVLKRAPDNLAAIRGLAELHARGLDGMDAQEAHDDAERHDREMQLALTAQETPAIAVAAEAFEAPTADTPVESLMPLQSAHSCERVDSLAAVDPMPADMATEILEAPTSSASLDAAFFQTPAQTFGLFESIDPVEPAPAEMAAESLNVPVPGAPRATVLQFENAHTFERTASLDPAAGIEDIDPVVELDVVTPMLFETPELLSFDPIEPMPFEIEDVIDQADESFDGRGVFDAAPPSMPAIEDEPRERLPVPSQAARPIDVLDEWLTRIRARRSELLSEYAAG